MSRLRAFAGDRRGNVVLIFALAIFVLGMLVAAAIDLTRASSSKSLLQDTTDAAVLAAAKSYHSNASKPATERLAAARAAADAYMTSMVASRSDTLLKPTWEA
jgi:Flp pilus assembly protein TadG